MLIALDYDFTWTADADLWKAFVQIARGRGHDVVIVTGRPDTDQFELERRTALRVICTNSLAKAPAVRSRLGRDADIWIDDRPEYVHADSVGGRLQWEVA